MDRETSRSGNAGSQPDISDVERALDFNRQLTVEATNSENATHERPGVAYAGDAVEVAPESKPTTDTTARNNYIDSELDPLASKVATTDLASPKASTKDSEADKPDEYPTTGQHLTFAASAIQTAGQVSHKLHVHRSHSRGPSEARQRRQSSIVVANPPRVPWYIHLRNALYGTLATVTTFPYWDMAFWSGWAYTWGSILFVIDGAWAWTPQAWPSSEFEGEAEIGVGVLFFVGALFYQLGAVVAYLEAINDGEFAGPAMKRHLAGKEDAKKQLLDEKLHLFFGHMVPHHHKHDDDEEEKDVEKQKQVDPEAGWRTRDRDERPGSVYPTGRAPAPRRGGVDEGPAAEDGFHEYLTWRWWPTWHAFRTYHIRQTGYIACAIQLFGATLYGICGVISLPGILSSLSPAATIGGYWVIQTIASCCFLTAGIMFTLVTQDVWYRPLPSRIAWWIGAWATIGSVGFLLSATFGIASGESTWCEYQSSLASMWGSFAYLVSSYLQWFESVNKGPVLAFPNNRIPSIMR